VCSFETQEYERVSKDVTNERNSLVAQRDALETQWHVERDALDHERDVLKRQLQVRIRKSRLYSHSI